MSSTRSIVLAASATAATGLVAYAAWFDYKRRNDADFRRKLCACQSDRLMAAKHFGA